MVGVQFQNAEVDDLLLKGATTFDQGRRKEIYGRIQQVIREELAILPIFQQTLVEGTKDNLIGFQPNINTSSNCWNIREWYWA